MIENGKHCHPEGVFWVDESGTRHLVHEYTGEDYGVEDICMLFGCGNYLTEGEEIVLTLNDSEVRNLKHMADAQSFDHPEDFIAMCLDIFHFARDRGPGPFHFRANF